MVGLSQGEVAKTISFQTEKVPFGMKPYADHLVDFDVPTYNIWKAQEKSEGATHPGNSAPVIPVALVICSKREF